ncbi:MAG TPA: hypothetical protein VGD43_13440, partial [Micromonospora sp.]
MFAVVLLGAVLALVLVGLLTGVPTRPAAVGQVPEPTAAPPVRLRAGQPRGAPVPVGPVGQPDPGPTTVPV